MKKFLAAAMTLLTVSYASAQMASIEGNWGAQQQSNGISFDMTFSISKNAVVITNICTGFGSTVAAQVTAASTYNENTLSFLEAKQDFKSNGPLNCNVQIQVDSLNYVVQGSSLIFTHVGSPESVVLQRK